MTDIRLHVPDLETCEMLRDAGFPQETCLIWRPAEKTPWVELRNPEKKFMKYYQDKIVAAPLATEILKNMPKWSALNQEEDFTCLCDMDAETVDWYYTDKNPATACALMWLKLKKENKL